MRPGLFGYGEWRDQDERDASELVRCAELMIYPEQRGLVPFQASKESRKEMKTQQR